MTATEELRRLLDERGVEWHGSEAVYWMGANAVESIYEDDALDVMLYGVTPKQAVAATLGRGTCEVEGYDDGVDEGMDGEWYSYGPPTWHLSCGHEAYGSERPCYCSTCGRKVIE